MSASDDRRAPAPGGLNRPRHPGSIAWRWLLALLGLAILPWVLGSDFYVNMASQVVIYALLAVSLNLLIGFAGLTSLGHAAYLGIAAYAAAWLAANTDLGTLGVAAGALLIGTLSATFFGVLALRATGLGFLMITLALGQIVWGVAYRWVSLTGGDNGIRLAARPAVPGLDLNSPVAFYYFVAAVFALAFLCIRRLSLSPFGACLRGAKEQPRRMTMLGHDVWRLRLAAFVLSGFWGSVSGLLYLYYHKFVSPQALSLQQSAEALLMVILGGASSLTGPIVGAVVITLVKNVVSSYVDRWYTLLGVIFIAVVVLMPQGIVPGVAALLRRLRGARPARRAAAQRVAP